MDLRTLCIRIGFISDKASINRTQQNIERAKKGLKDIGNEADSAKNKLNGMMSQLGALAAFSGISIGIKGIIDTVDEWKVIEGQVNNVTKSQQESKAVQEEIYDIASRTRQKYQSTAELFTSVARNAESLKKNNKEILTFTEDVANAMLLGGGSDASQQAALVQLGQALGSGVLRGDELNSILEQAPRLAKAIAEGMGTTISNLRQMGQDGKLTSQDVFKAIRSQSDKLKGELGKMPWTVGQATTKMSNAYGKFLKKLEDTTGICDRIAKSIAKVSEYIEHLDIDNFVAGLRVATVFAGVLLTMSKWGLLIKTLASARFGIIALCNALKMAIGMQVIFNSQTKKGAALQMLAMGKFLLIAAAITFLILLIQDLYRWMTDDTADTMMGRWFGSFTEFKKKVADLFSKGVEFWLWLYPLVFLIRFVWKCFSEGKGIIADVINFIKQAFSNLAEVLASIGQIVTSVFKITFGTIGYIACGVILAIINTFKYMQEAFTAVTESLAQAFSSFINSMIDGVKKAIGWVSGLIDKMKELNILDKAKNWATENIINPTASLFGIDSNPSDRSTNVNNSGNQTNYITVNAGSNASPADIGAATANGISRSNGGLGVAIDYSNPIFNY